MFAKTLLFATLLITSFLFPSVAKAHEASESGRIVIHMQDSGFDPSDIVLEKGETVVFENTGKKPHWPASNIHPTHDIYPEFDPKKAIEKGGSWEFTFSQSGIFQFHDHLNPTFGGKVSVEGQEQAQAALTPQKTNRPQQFFEEAKFFLIKVLRKVLPGKIFGALFNQEIRMLVSQKKDKELGELIALDGPEKVMQKLFKESRDGKLFNCHIPAHSVGRVAYKVLKEEALTLNIGLCHSGYVHGSIAAFIKETGDQDLPKRVSEVCEKLKTDFAKLGCYHASGHGIMAYLNADLPGSISKCKEYDTDFKRKHCMVGVFMENIASRFGDSLSAHKTDWLSDKPHFPCDGIEQDPLVQKMCYSIQPNWMRILSKNNMDNVVSECLQTKGDFIPSCFFGFGQEATLISRFKPEKIMEVCNKVPKDKNYFDMCLIGAQAVIMDFWGPGLKDQASQFCALQPPENKESCLKRMQERIMDLSKGT